MLGQGGRGHEQRAGRVRPRQRRSDAPTAGEEERGVEGALDRLLPVVGVDRPPSRHTCP